MTELEAIKKTANQSASPVIIIWILSEKVLILAHIYNF